MILETENKRNSSFTVGDIAVGSEYSFLITYFDETLNSFTMVCLDGVVSSVKLHSYTKDELLTWIKINNMAIYSKNNYKLKLVELAL